MKTIKVIDLLNKIANKKEVPKKIKFEYLEYELMPERNNYYCSEHMRWFTNEINALGVLNDEVEIIEEDKKIEKLNTSKYFYVGPYTENQPKPYDIDVFKKINEIIDYINK